MITTKWLTGLSAYEPVFDAMQSFTANRDGGTPDEIWLVEHAPVYTLGQAGKPEHILNAGDTPVIHSNRGGQVTYHGPGQVVVYCLVDLRRVGLFVKEYVALLEDIVLEYLSDLGVRGACRQEGAPGVYVPIPQPVPSLAAAQAQRSGHSASADTLAVPAETISLHKPIQLAKIAAIGIKVSKGCAYHGLALNVDMDLTPFDGINPCGYKDLKVTDLAACGIDISVKEAGDDLAFRISETLSVPI